MVASDYRCARVDCNAQAVGVYQGPRHPGIYGVCPLHLIQVVTIEYEGGRWVHRPPSEMMARAAVSTFGEGPCIVCGEYDGSHDPECMVVTR